MSEQDDALFVESILEQDVYEPARKREKAEYDGINGVLPDWVPDYYKNQFKHYRNRLLDSRGYSYDELNVWLDRYRNDFLADNDEFEDFIFFYPRKYPNGKPVDHYAFFDEIGLLAWLRWCFFDIGEEIAKKQLDAGFSVANVGDKGRESKNKKIEASKEFIFKKAQDIWDEQAKEGRAIYTVPVMAKKMLKQLKEEVKGKDIYFIPAETVMPRWINGAIKEGVLIKP